MSFGTRRASETLDQASRDTASKPRMVDLEAICVPQAVQDLIDQPQHVSDILRNGVLLEDMFEDLQLSGWEEYQMRGVSSSIARLSMVR